MRAANLSHTGNPAVRALIVRSTLLAVIATGCTQDDPLTGGGREPGVRISLEVSALSAQPGESVTVAVVAHTVGDAPITGLQGSLLFNTGTLTYLGQVVAPASSVDIVNHRGQGEGRVSGVSFHGGALPERTMVLAFQVTDTGFARGLGYRMRLAAAHDFRPLTRAEDGGVRENRSLPSARGARTLSLDDWSHYLGGSEQWDASGRRSRPLYGDATRNGSITMLDAAFVASIVAGNEPPTTGAGALGWEAALVSNVAPLNVPSLGEAVAVLAPGTGADGTRTLDVVDVALIAEEAVGNDRAVVGEFVPGRAPPFQLGARLPARPAGT